MLPINNINAKKKQKASMRNLDQAKKLPMSSFESREQNNFSASSNQPRPFMPNVFFPNYLSYENRHSNNLEFEHQTMLASNVYPLNVQCITYPTQSRVHKLSANNSQFLAANAMHRNQSTETSQFERGSCQKREKKPLLIIDPSTMKPIHIFNKNQDIKQSLDRSETKVNEKEQNTKALEEQIQVTDHEIQE